MNISSLSYNYRSFELEEPGSTIEKTPEENISSITSNISSHFHEEKGVFLILSALINHTEQARKLYVFYDVNRAMRSLVKTRLTSFFNTVIEEADRQNNLKQAIDPWIKLNSNKATRFNHVMKTLFFRIITDNKDIKLGELTEFTSKIFKGACEVGCYLEPYLNGLNNIRSERAAINNFPLFMDSESSVVLLLKPNKSERAYMEKKRRYDDASLCPPSSNSLSLYSQISDRLKDNQKIAIAALGKDPRYFKELKAKFRDDEEVLFEAIAQDVALFDLATERLKSDRSFIERVVERFGLAIIYVNIRFHEDKEIVLKAVKQDYRAFFSSPTIIRKFSDDKDIMMVVIAQHEYAYNFASERLKKDPDIIYVSKDKSKRSVHRNPTLILS